MRNYERRWYKPMCRCGERMIFKAGEGICSKCRERMVQRPRKPRNVKARSLRLYLGSDGYYTLWYGRKNAQPLHRFLYALSTGRDIRRRVIHHKNGRLDNRPESLVDLSPAEHQRIHNMLGVRPLTNTEHSARRRRICLEKVRQEQRSWRQRHAEHVREYNRRYREKRAAV